MQIMNGFALPIFQKPQPVADKPLNTGFITRDLYRGEP
jgi:hypothetical protein